MRLLLAPLAALLLTPVLPVAAASADELPVQVTAVVQGSDGHLTFRTEEAGNGPAGRSLAAHWRGETRVLAAAVDAKIEASGTPDPLQGSQWALSTLSGPTLWDAGGASGQVVAVIDTGVDASHPDLAGIVRAGADFVDATGDGRTDLNGHGTHVAGIVAELAGNGIGGAGLAQGASILPVRVLAADGSGYDGDAARGLVWAADHGASVANLSFGGPSRSSVMDAAVSYALSRGVSVVASAGNSGAAGDPVLWPAADPGVIAVAAVDQNGVRPSWSSTGAHLAVSAPGVGIVSTVPGGGYESWSGTSMAAPFVSAAAALLRHSGTFTPASVRSRLMSTADDLGAAGFDPLYGAGRINVLAAEGLSAPAADPAPAPAADPAPATAPAPVADPAPAAAAPADSAPIAAAPSDPAPSDPAPAVIDPAPVAAEPVSAPFQPVPAALPFARMSLSRTLVGYGTAVTVSARTLAGGAITPDVPLRLERSTPAGWAVVGAATTGPDGLASWRLRAVRSANYRVAGDGFTAASVRLSVLPSISMSRLLNGRVRPGGSTRVRLQRRTATGWITVASVGSFADGSFRFANRLPLGALVRAVGYGAASPTVRT